MMEAWRAHKQHAYGG